MGSWLFVCVFMCMCVCVLPVTHANTFSQLAGKLHMRDDSSADTYTLRFLTVGDWGEVNTQQSAVAGQMGMVGEQFNSSFVLALGDNFYDSGVTSTSDPQWNNTYENVYTAPSLQKRWYAVEGNHDHKGNVSAEVDYTKLSKRWYMPALYYTKTFQVDSNSTLQIVFIDTVDLSIFDPTQLAWIKTTLSESTAQWLIVLGHYPVYSGGEHGNTPTLQTYLKPLLEQYHADAYLCGHDHTVQHLQSNNVNYFVSGAGAKQGTVKNIPQTLFADVSPGFMLHELNSTQMKVTIINGDGSTLYTYTATRTQKSFE